jgi:hypothetical protein
VPSDDRLALAADIARGTQLTRFRTRATSSYCGATIAATRLSETMLTASWWMGTTQFIGLRWWRIFHL